MLKSAFISIALVMLCASESLKLSQQIRAHPPQPTKAATIITAIAWNRSTTKIAIGDSDGKVEIRDATTNNLLTILRGHADAVTKLAWSSITDVLASASYDRTVRIWDVQTAAAITTFTHGDIVVDISWSPDGTKLLSAGGIDDSNPLRVWDVSSRQIIASTASGQTGNISWSPDGLTVVLSLPSGNLRILDAIGLGANESELLSQPTPHGTIVNIAWNLTGSYVMTGGLGGWITVWSITSKTAVANMQATDSQEFDIEIQPQNVRALSYNADGSRIGSLTSDGMMRIWNTTDYALIEERHLPAPLYAAAWSPNGQSLAYGDTKLHIVDTSSLMHPKMDK